MDDEPKWFAMRATYRSELDMKDRLETAGLRAFVPMKSEKVVVRGRVKHTLVPAISSLIFVYGPQPRIQEFKISHPRLQYMHDVSHTTRVSSPLVVPTCQMEAFMALCLSDNAQLFPCLDNFKPGMPVRIVSGPLAGLQGTFQRISGCRERRFVVSISGVALVTTTEVDASMIEPVVS